MLADSNLIIYASKLEHEFLRGWFATEVPSVSGITFVEVLGYHRLQTDDRTFLEGFFAAARVEPLSPPVLNQAVKLRQTKKISLGDSLVAATALVNGMTLATRNVSDFAWIPGLALFNPFDRPVTS